MKIKTKKVEIKGEGKRNRNRKKNVEPVKLDRGLTQTGRRDWALSAIPWLLDARTRQT